MGKRQAAGQLFGVPHFVADGGVGGASADREIVAADHDRAAVDTARAEDEIRRRERGQVAGFVVDGPARQRSRLVEAGRIGGASMRSRTVRRPLACCRAIFSAPPIRRASSSRRRISSTSGCQVTSVPPEKYSPPEG